MKVADANIPDVKIIEPTVFEDERGFFFESFVAPHKVLLFFLSGMRHDDFFHQLILA